MLSEKNAAGLKRFVDACKVVRSPLPQPKKYTIQGLPRAPFVDVDSIQEFYQEAFRLCGIVSPGLEVALSAHRGNFHDVLQAGVTQWGVVFRVQEYRAVPVKLPYRWVESPSLYRAFRNLPVAGVRHYRTVVTNDEARWLAHHKSRFSSPEEKWYMGGDTCPAADAAFLRIFSDAVDSRLDRTHRYACPPMSQEAWDCTVRMLRTLGAENRFRAGCYPKGKNGRLWEPLSLYYDQIVAAPDFVPAFTDAVNLMVDKVDAAELLADAFG